MHQFVTCLRQMFDSLLMQQRTRGKQSQVWLPVLQQCLTSSSSQRR